jgi:hypothetical protein
MTFEEFQRRLYQLVVEFAGRTEYGAGAPIVLQFQVPDRRPTAVIQIRFGFPEDMPQ